VRRWLGAGLVGVAVVGVGAWMLSAPTLAPLPAGPSPLPHAAPPCAPRSSGGDWLPDPGCTPGARNPRVTQANIASTVCRPGWATAERKRWFPYPASERVKGRLVRAYGAYAGPSLGGYELDHLIPISLGGDPADVANLWPESPATPNPKDKVEAWARAQVCAGRMTLAAAQTQMASDWRQLDAGDTTTGRGLSGGETDE
jgi:hypothetical protein